MIIGTESEMRTRIVQRCTELFGRHGFARISMDEVAGSLGMSKKTVYKYFPRKEEIVKTIVHEFREETMLQVKRIAEDKHQEPITKIVRILETVALRLNMLQHAFIADIQKYLPDFWKEADEKRREAVMTMFQYIMEEGKREGIFRRDIDPEIFSYMFTHSAAGLITPDALGRLPYTASQIFQHIVSVLFKGIMTDAARSKYIGLDHLKGESND
jgi:AcrR family transcriptional regulator